MSHWQPIETAPRGPMILYCYPKDGTQWSVGLAYYSVSGHWHDSEGIFRRVQPTHWMPLPDPPRVKSC